MVNAIRDSENPGLDLRVPVLGPLHSCAGPCSGAIGWQRSASAYLAVKRRPQIESGRARKRLRRLREGPVSGAAGDSFRGGNVAGKEPVAKIIKLITVTSFLLQF